MRLLVSARKFHADDRMALARREIGHLPRARQILRQLGNRDRLDQNPKQALVKLVSKVELLEAPA